MFGGLLKLAAYGLAGYALYEFLRGLTGDMGPSGGLGRPSHHDFSRDMRQSIEREIATRHSMGNAGNGMKVAFQDPDGGSGTHTVGRGVVGG